VALLTLSTISRAQLIQTSGTTAEPDIPTSTPPCWVPSNPLSYFGNLAHQIPECNATQFETGEAEFGALLAGRKLKGIISLWLYKPYSAE
jgi:hypothetical protein